MSFEVPIERGKIREFAKAAKSEQSAYDRPGAVIEPTFLTVARNFWAPRESGVFSELNFDLARMLHGEEEFEFYGPLPTAGQVLHGQTRLGEQWEKEGRRGGIMKFARIVTEFRNDDGTLVAEQRSTIIETARPSKES